MRYATCQQERESPILGRCADDASIHDKDDTYNWGFGSPDGAAFTVFLSTLNTEPCFAVRGG